MSGAWRLGAGDWGLELPPGRYFRLLPIGYFEGLREPLGLILPEAPPDPSTISRTRRLIDVETHEAVFTWMLQPH